MWQKVFKIRNGKFAVAQLETVAIDDLSSERRVLDAINSDMFCAGRPGAFRWVFDALLHGGDPYFLLADSTSYGEAQEAASRIFQSQDAWTRKAILNVARVGKFSSDRTIHEYAKDI